jgi:hypothetical protein
MPVAGTIGMPAIVNGTAALSHVQLAVPHDRNGWPSGLVQMFVIRCLEARCKAGELEAVLLARGVDAQKLERVAARKDKVLSYYNSRRQASDPEMPCIQQTACPCWGADYTDASFWTAKGATQCDDTSADSVMFKSITAGQSNNTVNIRAYSNAGVGPHFCSLSDQATGEFSLQKVSETDARFCGLQISATCSLLQ